MATPGWRQALERLVLHLLFCLVAAVIGYGFGEFGSLGVPQSRVPPWIPEGIGWFGLSVIFAGFAIAGWCGSWAAYSWVLFFAAGMIPIAQYRIEVHRAAPLWSAFHPYGTALVLVAPGALAAWVGAGLGALARTTTAESRIPSESIIAERRRRLGKRMAFVAVSLFILPFPIGLLEATLVGPLFMTTFAAMIGFPVGILLLAASALVLGFSNRKG